MLCIRLAHKDPFFCLAAEEFLLKNYADDIFMIWQSDQTVVVGKHQNAMGEINYRFTREKNIRVARRISGGGTVYHDAGNLNFAWFRNVAGPQEISFRHFTQPIIDVLGKLGIKAESSGRNDLLVEGKKISGNAEHVFKNRVLHHGTLLFDADLARLGDAIRVIPGRYAGKAVASNRSMVANISGFLSQPMDLEKFTGFLVQEILSTNPGNRIFDIPEPDLNKIRELAENKFETWEWQFGYSPTYTFDNAIEHIDGTPYVRLKVDKGIISEADISGGPYTQDEITALEKAMPGQKHWFESVQAVHRDLGIAFSPDLIYCWF